MKHFVITIGCEYGSGGPDIGKIISSEMGIKFYDRDLVDKVVESLNVDKTLVEKADLGEKVKYEFETTLGPRYANLTNKVIGEQFEVIRQLAQSNSCVFIGRCANYILKERQDVLNVFLYAPLDYRVQHIVEHKAVSKANALKIVKYNDDMLKSRYRYVTGNDWGERMERDVLINTSVLGIEKTARMILDFAVLKFAD